MSTAARLGCNTETHFSSQALNVSNSEEADPLLHCYFKTEFVTHLMQRTNAAVQVNIGPSCVVSLFSFLLSSSSPPSFCSIAYSKKKDKQAQITFKKDETVRKDDVYKSSAVSVPSGEPANSASWPPAERKAVAPRPVTSGKLVRPGGPSQAVCCSFLFPSVHLANPSLPLAEAQAHRSRHPPVAASPCFRRLCCYSRRSCRHLYASQRSCSSRRWTDSSSPTHEGCCPTTTT